MNNITLTGNLVADPIQREVSTGKNVTEFKIAVDRRFKVNGQKVTDFYRINVWNKLGDICFQYLAKGRKVAVIGELQPRTYDDKEGVTRMSLDVVADQVEFMNSKAETATEEKPKKTYTEADFTDIQTEDIPF